MNMNPRESSPVVIDCDELAELHSWQPFGHNWWSTVIGASGITLFIIEALFGWLP